MIILGTDYDIVTLDFETYYGTGCSLSLQKLNTYSYLAHPEFTIHGAGVKLNDAPTEWIAPADLETRLREVFEDGDKPVALICHNTYFDGFILHHFYNLHPDLYLDTMGMSRGMFPNAKHGLKDLAVRLWPGDETMRKGEELISFRNVTTEALYANPIMLQRMVEYCEQDVELTYAAFMLMVDHYPDSELELLHLTLQMTCEPLLHVDKPRVEAARVGWIEERDRIIAESGVAESTLSSNPKFLALLEKHGVQVLEKYDPKTEKMKPALGKADLGFQQMKAAHPEIDRIFEGRVAAKSTGQISRAARFLETAEICGGLMPCPLIYYSAHCVPGDTEVLTEQGWKRLDEWQGGAIAQVDTDQRITFDDAERFVGPTVSEWAVADARYMQCAFTLGHSVPYLQHGTFAWNALPAGDAMQRGSLYVPIGGKLDTQGSITPEQMRVLVMIQADGSYCTDTAQGRQMTVFVKKERKIRRARKILDAAGVIYRESTFPSHPGYVRFTVAARDYPEWMTPERKVFGAWLLDSTPEARQAFVGEITEWDGGYNGATQRTYTSSVKENVDWAVTLCHLTERSASICENPANQRGGYDRQANYVVSIRSRAHAQIKRGQWLHADNTPQRTYCAKTKTGYWLARANGRIFVTGNTGRYGGGEKLNLQNLTRGSELRKSLIAPPGHLVYVADSSNIEARMLAWVAGQPDLLEVFREGGDVYAHFATKLYGFPVNKDDHPHERFVGKVCVLGLGYGMGWRKFQDSMAAGMLGGDPVLLTDLEAQAIVKLYRDSNYAIAGPGGFWSQAQAAITDMYLGVERDWGPMRTAKNMLILPNGMALKYPGLRPMDEHGNDFEYFNGRFWTKIYGGKFTENIIQALARIVLFDQMLEVNRLLLLEEGRVVLNVHDEIIGIAPDGGARLVRRADPDVKGDKDVWENDSWAMALFDRIVATMSEDQGWYRGLPLEAEGGFDLMYSK